MRIYKKIASKIMDLAKMFDFKFRYDFLLVLVLALHISGCGFLERNTLGLFSGESAPTPQGFRSDEPQGPPVSKETDISQTKPEVSHQTPVSTSSIELFWTIPEESVDGYVIHYGYDRSKLDSELKVPIAELSKQDDPRLGFVFRYLLSGVKPDRSVFVSLAAYKGSQISESSSIMEVKPQSAKANIANDRSP